jgi:hypothetical protein
VIEISGGAVDRGRGTANSISRRDLLSSTAARIADRFVDVREWR